MVRPLIAAVTARWRALPGVYQGILMSLASGFLFSLMNWQIKAVGQVLPVVEVAFFRAAFGLLTTMPFVILGGWAAVRTERIGRHAARGLLGALSMMLGFWATVELPLADALALNFTKGLFVVPLAAIYLGEKLRAPRIAALVVGFGGVLVMLQPEGSVQPAALAMLFSAFLIGFIVILIKKLVQTEKPVTVMFYFGLFMTLGSVGPAIYAWQNPTAEELLRLLLVGALGTAAQSLIIRAYRAADATVLGPVEYAQLIFAAIIGYLVFGDIPGPATAIGAGLIVVSGLVLVWSERRRR